MKKKDKRKEKNEEKLKKTEEEIQRMISELKQELGEDSVDIKVIELDKHSKKQLAFIKLIEFLFGFITLIGCIGIFHWVKSDALYKYILVCFLISFIDYFLNFILRKFFLVLILKTIGMIKIVPLILAFIIPLLFIPGVEIISIPATMITFVLYIVIKRIIVRLFGDKNFGIQFKR